jgi:DNA-3-methyladenine glycosylase
MSEQLEQVPPQNQVVVVSNFIDPPLLSRAFFARSAEVVARESLGKTLVRATHQGLLMGRIVETEAYLGEHDPAAHASFGRTKRTHILYGEPGHAYVYQSRAYHCLNFVAEPLGLPGCVLIRAVEPLRGIELMKQFRGKSELGATSIADGPGKLCRAMDIDMKLYGTDVLNRNSPLQIWESLDDREIQIGIGHRIGITKAADWDLRFTIMNNPYVSHRRVPTQLFEEILTFSRKA